jgi:hypothetical protein
MFNHRLHTLVPTALLALVVLAAPLACKHANDARPFAESDPGAAAAARLSSPKSAAARPTTGPTSRPVVAEWHMNPLPAGEVNLILMGDWGNGKPKQKTTAKAMADYVAGTGVQFNGALTVGDNFYVKMRDANDWYFQGLFEDMYDAKRLNFPFFPSMGNHDYEKAVPDSGRVKADLEREYARMHPDSRWKASPAKWYRVDFPQGSDKPLVTALMIESSKPRLTPAEWAEQKRWIAEQLTQSPAPWKIACAHHPLFSNGSHGDNGVLQQEWGPIFKAAGLDMYIGGHDHDLQHLEIPGYPYSFVQAGGGGQGITDMRRDLRGPFSRKLYGFVHFRAAGGKADVRYVAAPDARNPDVRVIHHFAREKETGKVTVVSTTGIDRATTKPLKTLIGVGEQETKGATKEDATKK